MVAVDEASHLLAFQQSHKLAFPEKKIVGSKFDGDKVAMFREAGQGYLEEERIGDDMMGDEELQVGIFFF